MFSSFATRAFRGGQPTAAEARRRLAVARDRLDSANGRARHIKTPRQTT
jgi:hypothetical protein